MCFLKSHLREPKTTQWRCKGTRRSAMKKEGRARLSLSLGYLPAGQQLRLKHIIVEFKRSSWGASTWNQALCFPPSSITSQTYLSFYSPELPGAIRWVNGDNGHRGSWSRDGSDNGVWGRDRLKMEVRVEMMA